MDFCTNDSIQTISMSKPIRKGFLQFYKKRFLCSNWRKKTWVVLHEDSSLEWFKDEDENNILGGIVLKEAPQMIAAGPFASYVPNKPEPPKNVDVNCLMVFGTKSNDRVAWFIAENLDDLNQWMTAVSNTLPPPPNNAEGNPANRSNDPPPPYVPSKPSAPPPHNPRFSNPTTSNSIQLGSQIIYPQGVPTYSGGPVMKHEYPRGGNTNTVIIDRDRGGGHVGDFATGMLMGSALSGWGCGWGWGIGPSVGFGFGGWGHGIGFGGFRGFNNTDVSINNTYNITNEAPNNEADQPVTEEGNDDNTGDPETDATPAINDNNNSLDPGLDAGVDPNGFQPGFEPDAEFIPNATAFEPDAELIPDVSHFGGPSIGPDVGIQPNGVDSGLLEGGMIAGIDPGLLEGNYGGFDMGGFDGGGGFETGGFDMGGFDGGGFDGGGFDFGF